MEITKEFIKEQKEKFPNCDLSKVCLKSKDGKETVLITVVRSPDRKVIGEAEKYEMNNPGKAKEIYVRNCTLTDVERIMADDNLFYQAYFAITELLPFQKPDIENL